MLDPIDGTRGFVGLRQYAICLGLLDQGQVRKTASSTDSTMALVPLQDCTWPQPQQFHVSMLLASALVCVTPTLIRFARHVDVGSTSLTQRTERKAACIEVITGRCLNLARRHDAQRDQARG